MRLDSSTTRHLAVAAFVALLATSGCATVKAHPNEARFLTVSAIDSVTTWAALERGATERNPLYRSGDPATVAVTSFAVSVVVTWAIQRATRRLSQERRDATWFTVTALRGIGIPFNLDAALSEDTGR